jgi:tRNA pseudouridine38-40 synthase
MSDRSIRLVITFDGTAYKGWQRQKSVPTVQGVLEKKISLLCAESITLHGAGRTDAGVHALGMVAHFHTNAAHPLPTFYHGLNSLLPPDIRILEAKSVSPDFHSRYSALGKTYRYDFFTGRVMPPTRRLYETHFPCSFDLAAVRKCLQLLIGSHDFASFEGSGSRNPLHNKGRGSIRTVFRASCLPIRDRADHFSFFITGDGFLRHMVRNMVGTLLPAGQNKISTAEFGSILRARNRSLAGPTAPAHGLFLQKIYYKDREFQLFKKIQ